MTQLLAAMVAETAPPYLRTTAFGFFNLTSGVALPLATGTAVWLWERLGAEATFLLGTAFATAALALLMAWCKPA